MRDTRFSDDEGDADTAYFRSLADGRRRVESRRAAAYEIRSTPGDDIHAVRPDVVEADPVVPVTVEVPDPSSTTTMAASAAESAVFSVAAVSGESDLVDAAALSGGGRLPKRTRGGTRLEERTQSDIHETSTQAAPETEHWAESACSFSAPADPLTQMIATDSSNFVARSPPHFLTWARMTCSSMLGRFVDRRLKDHSSRARICNDVDPMHLMIHRSQTFR